MNTIEELELITGETIIFLRKRGTGPPLLLLHGFPQTHLMWRDIEPLLADQFTLLCPDLRGYGRSGCPLSDSTHTPYSKRAMARDMVDVMDQLGYDQFAVAGHDRGGRVAYRLALDHPGHIERLAVLDVVPTAAVWDRADRRFADAYWPWNLFAQPEPLPERLILGAPDAIVDNALTNWGSPKAIFPDEIREAYIEPLRDPAHVHAICEEYRAAATLDYEHDTEDKKQGRRIQCPMLAFWGAGGPLDTWYEADGGPLRLWRQWADDVQGWPIKGGHFFPEELPDETAQVLSRFFSGN
ncbi:alpha/beta fold hydrolase [Spirosoma validum]|uniref:Alpha/beta hydrolase n=1 Tax=Spirosoma validum TaxID=2771355 RepID=A0A927B728_9BACT|nr:alpha/beta hydrolase [Spirosoma validum]MBD2756660.1 alpha/beta hydrolase [Spirosoma validum]